MSTEFDYTRDCCVGRMGACYWVREGFRECTEQCIEAAKGKPEEIEEEEDEYQSREHEGPCCSSCDWEWAYTDIGMRNFGFGCCCKTTIHDKD